MFVEDRIFNQINEGIGYCEKKSFYDDVKDTHDVRVSELCGAMYSIGFKTGATKMVFIFEEDEDHVYKIPFLGTKINNNFIMFTEANNNNPILEKYSAWDYCEIESEVYKFAENEGLGDMFAATYKIGTLDNGIPVYYSDRVEELEDDDYEFKNYKNSKKLSEYINSDGSVDIDDDVIVKLVDCYGKKKVEQLVDFLDELWIGDLLPWNIGKDRNGNVVIFDYSGYNER
jgi:hypothetical protein